MGGIREKLYNAAEKFDRFLDNALKRLPAWARAVIMLLIGGLAGAATLKGKTHLAYLLLGCGIIISLGAITATRRAKHKKNDKVGS